MVKKNILLIFLLDLLLISISLTAAPALAQGEILPPASGGADQACIEKAAAAGVSDAAAYCGNYTVNDFVVLMINVSKWILGIVGSLSLVMFIYGGITFLVSAGSSETVGKAKKIIVAAVIGLIIVFASYLIIKFVLQAMGLNWEGTIAVPKKISLLFTI